MKYAFIAAAITLALAIPASAQMANDTAKTTTTMKMQDNKPMAEGSMAMSGDAAMKKPMKKSKKSMMMGDKPMADGMMKPDSMKH